ncbi:DUF3558 domain-containing protein [Amycolatopsis acidiphila]|uniref:DUF3558 domain-containing protein n=1 Tax=Amycolatopsis acidiphila TaxID=715473 RepID=A0A558A6L7_9PSEU|nr:DUF3558 domain-containing protein [Amycolatopsis acidiphila]TVT19911.1 DUF3558 domain-containing protein [Amycolatopsis acidiphila]UIJ60096.1 DUF3558 domain-containing protein [Amycolatopsis acidiphila]GHG61390.1 hypothetical protein GCM10017788_16040 [Amycolatopsis acidiphila]
MSKTRAFQLGAAALVAAGVLSACSGGGGSAGSIPPATSASSAASSSSSGGGLAPSVANPLPTDAIVANPCSALSAAQVTQIGLTGSGDLSHHDVGPTCEWKSATSSLNSVYIAPVTADKNGLSDVYATRQNDKYFEPTTVSGYPAVYAGVSDRSDGDCSLWVGVTDQLTINVQAQIGSGPNKSNPCPVAERVATAMVQHLQGS